jgi:predicted Zn-dependent protease with MMP-like domain
MTQDFGSGERTSRTPVPGGDLGGLAARPGGDPGSRGSDQPRRTRVRSVRRPSHPPRRDRHGRGLRGRLVPATVPLARTRAEIFDDLVLDTVEELERRFAKELADVEFAVEDVPPELNVYDSDVLEDGEVPLARLQPIRLGEPDSRARIVLYRRPLELRASHREDLADLVHDVIIEQVANLLGVDPDDLVD